MITAVLDTNVVVSAHLNPEGSPALIWDLAVSKYFRCPVSLPILEEYEDVLKRPHFGFSPESVSRSIRVIRQKSSLVAPRKRLNVTSDPGDNKFVECALEARADYIVTGNIRHFPAKFQDIRIISPRQFLTVLASN